MLEHSKSVIAIMGPTASGKTDLALTLAREFPVEIISVDSALVYRDMNIGTAKPEQTILDKVPHHLIDIRDPAQCYSAAEFREDALALIADILARGKYPLLVGGTMLYYRALFSGLSLLPSADPQVREYLDEQARQLGWAQMHQQLAQVDPQAAARINPNDPQRIQRALEIYHLTGRAMSDLYLEQVAEPFPWEVLKVVVAPGDRARLHQRIEARFRQMLEQGLIDEVTTLKARGDLSLELPSMRAVGYRQVWEYLDGVGSYEDMVVKGVAATRQLAKRQFTWLRKEPETVWFDSDQASISLQVVDFFYMNGCKLST